MILALTLALNVLCAFACGYLAERKGRLTQAWVAAGAVFGPLPLVVLAMLPGRETEKII